jgi:hypothetical protein
MLLRVVLSVDVTLRSWRDHFERGVSDYDGQTEGQIQHAALTAVLESRTCQADVGTLLSRGSVGLPAKDGEWACADLTFLDDVSKGFDNMMISLKL